ncbi:hypothetical protein BUALT_Bualt18G0033100 [Buddleja alternifolia]|uniref:Trichome birefringence-like C-terminal domain-containing protein n=1 Tax=Buddleja alternifolia TaxID=168488 RepID=A0AAV6W322_9LAMI|nr:hypothetical protein BUALT_Bualt18G0033100 [Buddleja alternifolia]
MQQMNLTLMYMRNAFIVDIAQRKSVKVLKLNSISPASAKQWLQSDILIFDTWHWWLHTGRKQPWDMIEDGKVMRKDMNRLEAYEKALRTWSRWVNHNVNTNKVKLFFQGVSPDHWNASEWGKPERQRCGEQGEPLVMEGRGAIGSRNEADIILKKVLKRMKKKKQQVHLLDINKLSQYRVDAHPSIYGNPRNIGMDCTHWCLPGVPDAWNQLLYATL